MKSPYDRGARAAKRQGYGAINPYTPGTLDHNAWRRGFDEAFRKGTGR